MKKSFYIFLILVTIRFVAFSNLSETYHVPSESFPDIESIVSYINNDFLSQNDLSFVVEGNTVFNESLLKITASGTQTAQIFIRWDGVGAKPVINFEGTSEKIETGITFSGAKFITIDGFDIRNPNGMIENGFFLTNSDSLTGSQFITIKNTHITLNKLNPNVTIAVKIEPEYTPYFHGGSNSYNSFLNNHISNTLFGYQFNSLTGNVELMDIENVIGVEDDGEHIIDDIVFAGVYLLNQNGATIDGVQISNLYRPDDGTNVAPAAISTTGTFPTSQLTQPFVFSNNTINGHTSESTSIFGMYLNQRNAHYEIFNNRLSKIKSETTTSGFASGILLFATGVSGNIYNNMITDISAPDGSLNNAASVRGIDVRTFDSVNIFYNTVLIDYKATNPENKSTALNVHNSANPVDIRNNIFVNKSTVEAGGKGFATAFFKSTNTISNIQSTTDNNIYFAGEPSDANFIFYGHHGTNPAIDTTLTSFKERTQSFDQNSFTEDVPFLYEQYPYVDPLSTTVVRNNAQVISTPIIISTDIDGKLRNTETPDIGASELPEAFPNPVHDPSPADGATNIDLKLEKLSWKYTPDEMYILPAGFHVYFGLEENPEALEKLAWIPYDEHTEAYFFTLPETELLPFTSYIWKISPAAVSEDGPENDEIEIWSFKTLDNTNTRVLEEEKFVFFPNPATDNIRISAPQNGLLSIYNEQGKMMIQKNTSGNNESVDLSTLTPGIYLIRFAIHNHTTTQKLIITK